MSDQNPQGALGMSRTVLRIVSKLNLLMGAGILTLLVASLVAPPLVMEALGVDPIDAASTFPLGMRLIMVFGIAAVGITHTVLARLLTIVDTVTVGDPFILENATRLQKIAWAVLSLEILHLVIVALAAGISTPRTPLDIKWEFSVTRWLAVLLLFVLSRVFETGARMREELEGTV
jgi:hypothetical protein